MLNSAIAKAERRTLVFGVGIMDAESSGVMENIHSYSVWIGMLGRCYRKGKYEREAYSGCTVCDEWLTFSEFNKFYEKYHVEGYELDKDLLVPGNKVYMPSRCVFIPRSLMVLLLSGQHKKENTLLECAPERTLLNFRRQ